MAAADDGRGDAGGGVFFLLEHGVEILAEGGAGLGDGEAVEGGERLGERGVFPLAVGAGGEMGANVGGAGGVGGAGIQQVGKTFLGGRAVHGRRGKG